MRRFTIALVCFFAVGTSFSEVVNAQFPGPTGVYNVGGVTFRSVVDVVGLRINARAGGILVGGNATDLGGAASGNFGVVNDQAPNFIEWGNLLGMTFDSEFAGAVLPSGLNQGDLDANFEFLYRTASKPGVDQIGHLCLLDLCIPEPTAIALASLGMLGLSCTRRRRSVNE